MFCKHDWEVLESYRFDSIIEKMSKIGSFKSRSNGMFIRGVVSIVKCKKCGIVKHIKTEI